MLKVYTAVNRTQMSQKSRSSVEFVINPNTKRQIRVGGKTWQKLVKEGVVERGDWLPPGCQYKLRKAEEEDAEEISEISSGLKGLSIAKPTRRRRRANRVTYEDEDISPDTESRPLCPSPSEVDRRMVSTRALRKKKKQPVLGPAELASESALEVVDQIQQENNDFPDMDRDEAHAYLQKLIFDRMLIKKKAFHRGGTRTRVKPKSNRKEPVYYLEDDVYYLEDEDPQEEKRLAQLSQEGEPLPDDSEYEYVYQDADDVRITPGTSRSRLEEQQQRELYG